MLGEARQERKPQFDAQGHDCTLTAITCALRLRRHELSVQGELSDVIARSIRCNLNSWHRQMIGWCVCVRWRKAWKFSTVELCSIWRRATLSRARWRRRKYKPTLKVGLYFWRSQAPHTPPRSALVRGISWRVPIGVSMRKRLSKKYKPTRVHKRWQKLNDFQDTGLNNVY